MKHQFKWYVTLDIEAESWEEAKEAYWKAKDNFFDALDKLVDGPIQGWDADEEDK